MNDIIVDVIKDTGNQIIVSQNDNLTRIYKLIVTKNNARYNLSNKKVRFAFLKNGTNLGDIVEDLNISDATNGVVDFPITSTITRENGTFTCGLAIFNDSGYMENTAFFNMLVKESLFEKISGGLIDEGAYEEVLSLLEKGEKLQKILEPLVNRGDVVVPKLEDLVPRAESIAQPLQNAVDEAEAKKPVLDSSIESAKRFIENLDGSQNLPQMRDDITTLQNGLKSNQELAYEGTNLKCENTLDGRIEDIVLEGNTIKTGTVIKSVGEAEENKVNVLTHGKNLVNQDLWETTEIVDGIKCLVGAGWKGSTGGDGSPIVLFLSNSIRNGNYYLFSKNKATNHFNKFTLFNTKTLARKVFHTNSSLNQFVTTKASVSLNNEEYNAIIIDTGDRNSKGYLENIYFSEIESNEFIPYKEDKRELKLPFESGLKGLSNGARDLIYNKDDGCYVRKNIDKYIVNGAENIVNANTDNTITMSFKISKRGVKDSSSSYVLSDKFNFEHSFNDKEHIHSNKDFIIITINKDKLETQDVEGFKKWLSQNPITVYYELAEPVETKISDTKLSLDTYNGLTYVFSNNVISPNIKLKVASNVGSVVQQNSKSVNDIYNIIDTIILPAIQKGMANDLLSKLK